MNTTDYYLATLRICDFGHDQQFFFKGLVMAKSVFTCFQILKPTMNKWAQYPAQMEVEI